MDKNDINDALNELSGQIIGTGRAVGSERSAHDLELLSRSLSRYSEELMSIVNVLIDKQL